MPELTQAQQQAFQQLRATIETPDFAAAFANAVSENVGRLVLVDQPVAEVNGDSWDYRVPVHVLSRNPELVRPFVSRGYRPGMRPPDGAYSQGLETFLPSLLVDFSTERAPASQ